MVPAELRWASLLSRSGEELETHYRHVLAELGRKPGMLGEIFKKARQEIQNPPTLKRLIIELIDPVRWLSMEADVKGDIYEGLLDRSAQESPKGAGQYFTPRTLIKAIVDVMRPGPGDTVCDPACGTGGFLLSAIDHVTRHHGRDLDPDQKRHLREGFVHGWELVPATARLCVMNLYLHGINADPCPVRSGQDSLAADPGDRLSMVLTNPPFGRRSSIQIVNEEGDLESEEHTYERRVKANVLFFDARPAREEPWTEKLWVYDLRTNLHFTLKTNPLKRSDLDEFVACFNPENRLAREATWSEANPSGRWRAWSWEEIARRDKLNLDLLWLKDASLEDTDSLADPDILAAEIVADLQTALDAFARIQEELEEGPE
jgi:type I restriction enzyme M protein